jgi:cytochrome c oxidase subunit 3
MKHGTAGYYVPHGSYWPIVGAIGLALLTIGFARLLTDASAGPLLMASGGTLLIVMLFGWFSTVINESLSGSYNAQVDRTFRKGMLWFIFSEVMFFAAFFGALFYARELAVPWLGGEGARGLTHMLWPDFHAEWPLLTYPDPSGFTQPKEAMEPTGIPAINTLILLSSSVTVTWAHWGIKRNQRWRLTAGLALTVALGVIFLVLQAHEYALAYENLNLKLSSGVYGSTFFMLTGFHGAHVTIGAIMLLVMLFRAISGHFDASRHFAFEAASWYWHFVDVVWLCLFVFVYWL